jgi:hypothetical protein
LAWYWASSASNCSAVFLLARYFGPSTIVAVCFVGIGSVGFAGMGMTSLLGCSLQPTVIRATARNSRFIIRLRCSYVFPYSNYHAHAPDSNAYRPYAACRSRPSESCVIWAINRDTLCDWINAGKFKAYRVGNANKIDRLYLADWLEARELATV